MVGPVEKKVKKKMRWLMIRESLYKEEEQFHSTFSGENGGSTLNTAPVGAPKQGR